MTEVTQNDQLGLEAAGIEPATFRMRSRRSATELRPQNCEPLLAVASPGFDPGTFGLWAQHDSSAPRSKRHLRLETIY